MNETNASPFSIKQALSDGWQTLKPRFWLFIGAFLLMFAIDIAFQLTASVPTIIIPAFQEIQFLVFGLMGFSFVIMIAGAVVKTVNAMGLIRIPLSLIDKKETSIKDLFTCFPLFLKYIASNILYALIFIGGLILLIVPGIIWALKYIFWSYAIIDKNMGPIEAIKYSGKITQGAKWKLFCFFLVLVGVNLLGALALIIGLAVTIPLSITAYAHVYRTLANRADSQPTASVKTD